MLVVVDVVVDASWGWRTQRVVSRRVLVGVEYLDGVDARPQWAARTGERAAVVRHGASVRTEERPARIERRVARVDGGQLDGHGLALAVEGEGVGLADLVDRAADDLSARDRLGAVGLPLVVEARTRRIRGIEGGAIDRCGHVLDGQAIRPRTVLAEVGDDQRVGTVLRRLVERRGLARCGTDQTEAAATAVSERDLHATAVGREQLPVRIEGQTAVGAVGGGSHRYDGDREHVAGSAIVRQRIALSAALDGPLDRLAARDVSR